jgi:hypothetical protein
VAEVVVEGREDMCLEREERRYVFKEGRGKREDMCLKRKREGMCLKKRRYVLEEKVRQQHGRQKMNRNNVNE